MVWYQVGIIVGVNMAMFLWAVREARANFLCAALVISKIKEEITNLENKIAEIEEKRRKNNP
jgi:hypothetical protein